MAARVPLGDLGKDRHTSNGEKIYEPEGQGKPPDTIDPGITEKENANLKAYHEFRLSQLSLGESGIPNRPSYGNKGKSVVLRTNNLKVSMDNEQRLFTYGVVIDDRLTAGRKRQQFMQSALRQLPELRALGSGVATDYASLLVTSTRLYLNSSNHKIFALKYYDTELADNPVTAPINKPFKLQVSLTSIFSSSDLLRFTDPDPTTPGYSDTADNQVVRALNIVLANHPNKDPDVYRLGQNKFFRYPSQDAFSNYDLSGGIFAVRGYSSSVRFSTARALLNLNSQCTPFYKTMNVLDIVREFQQSTPNDWQALHNFLWLLRVKMSYMRAPDGTPLSRIRSIMGFSHKRLQSDGASHASGISDFNHGDATEIKFKLKGRVPEATVSVKEYFLSEYGFPLKHPGAIVLKFGTKDDPIWVPAELCNVIPGQHYRKKLNGSQTTRMLTIAARPPAENAARIMADDGGLGLIGVLPEESENLTTFGIKVDPRMAVVPGRVLSRPSVKYDGKANASKSGASWNMKDMKFVKAAAVLPWAMLRIGAAAKITESLLDEQYRSLTTSFKLCGLSSEGAKYDPKIGPKIPELKAPEDNSEVKVNRRWVNFQLRGTLDNCQKKGVDMLLVILPSADSWLYERIKYFGDVVYGVHTICHQMNKFSKADPMTAANIALKVNLKSGGTNHALSRGDLGFLEQGKTMLVGIDVTHPAGGSMKGTPSIAGVVASINADFNHFPGSIRCQESRKEMVSELDAMMEERLKLWMSNNINQRLENIIVYRDGVSEGQYAIVLREEVPAIRRACDKLLPTAVQPKITFIVVGKNHHNRFYPTSKASSNQKRGCNVQPGTVVDRGITMTRGWDFFLVAHEPLNGTAKPAHYTVIHDEIRQSKKLDANELEKITHNLCYLYGRATKAVSVCPPAYYAHLICLRARCYISDYVNRDWPADKEYDEYESDWHSAGIHEKL